MTPADMEKICRHYMSRLSPSDLEELDSQLNGTSEPMASDARLSPDQAKSFLAMDHKTRIAARSGRAGRAEQAVEAEKSFLDMFPDAGRLR